MTRLELLQLALARARAHGFEFRRWYTTRLGLPWISAEAATILLDGQRRYYALVFSHEFASAFWKAGADITFEVPTHTFQRSMPDGTVRTVERKGFIRRSVRRTAWRYHLQQMALAEDPLRHLRKYLHIEESLDPDPDIAASAPPRKRGRARAPDSPSNADDHATSAGRKSPGRRAGVARAMPTDQPAFLLRPYKGQGSGQGAGQKPSNPA